jgi:hypothetical protein
MSVYRKTAASEPTTERVADILFVVISSKKLPERRKYIEETWASNKSCDGEKSCGNFEVMFYDEEGPGVDCHLDLMPAGEAGDRNEAYLCAQQRLLFAVQHIVSLNRTDSWTHFIDDDAYVHMGRLTRLMGAIDETWPFYGGAVGEGECTDVRAYVPNGYEAFFPGWTNRTKTEATAEFPLIAVQVMGGPGHLFSRATIEAFRSRYPATERLYLQSSSKSDFKGGTVIDMCIRMVGAASTTAAVVFTVTEPPSLSQLEVSPAWQTCQSDLSLPMCYGMATAGLGLDGKGKKGIM